MFTGIIECIATVEKIEKDKGNLNISLKSSITKELKVDQSLCHNGVCLTVVKLNDDTYTVTVIAESLKKTNLGELKPGDIVNLERSMSVNSRFDGHVVQGHVDEVAVCSESFETNGSWKYVFKHSEQNITVEKGSITINGVSLTVVNSTSSSFSVAIIPYTYENTNFKKIIEGSKVNLEFDILGKYISKLIKKTDAS
jgi:riboflavin synthase